MINSVYAKFSLAPILKINNDTGNFFWITQVSGQENNKYFLLDSNNILPSFKKHYFLKWNFVFWISNQCQLLYRMKFTGFMMHELYILSKNTKWFMPHDSTKYFNEPIECKNYEVNITFGKLT